MSGIIRVIKNDSPYDDTRLSFGAWGVFAFLMSQENDCTIQDVISSAPNSEQETRELIAELEKFGYVEIGGTL